MKKTIAVFIISLVMMSCNSKSKEVFKPHSDTSRVMLSFIDFPSKDIKVGIGVQVVRRLISVDSILEAKVITDTLYYIMPTADTSNNFVLTFKDAVSMNSNIDTSVARLNRWIVANKNLWEKDSTVSDSPQNKPIQ